MAIRPRIDRRRLRAHAGLAFLVGCFVAVLIATTVATLIGKTPAVSGGTGGAFLGDEAAVGQPQDFNAELFLQPHVTAQLLAVKLNPIPGYATGHLAHLATARFTLPFQGSYSGWPPRTAPVVTLRLRPFPAIISGAGEHLVIYSIVADRPGQYAQHGVTITYRVGAITRHLLAGFDALACVPSCSAQTLDNFDPTP